MNKVRATAGLGAATAMLTLGWLAARPAEPPGAAAEPVEVLFHAPLSDIFRLDLVGSAGCNGVACHGGPVAGLVPRSHWGTNDADRERWRSSDTVWRTYDPHRKAYETLGNDLSKQIEARLAKPDETPLDARTDPRCLACHANPLAAPRPKETPDARTRALLAEGVSCEACHGNAHYWITHHAGRPAGPGHSDKVSSMTRLSDPKVRAETCAGCHVGAPAGGGAPLRDMNHDLIAAGHPRLNFDYATYLRALPPHWAEKDRDVSPAALRPATDEFRHWQVGRAATTAASYRLLADRASRGPWPELAEFDCYACHQGLEGKTASKSHRLGTLVWNEPPLVGQLSGPDLGELRSALRRPTDADAIRKHADQAADAWGDVAKRWATDPLPPTQVAGRLADVKPRRWDEACHLYYALLAIDRADPARAADPRLAELRNALKLPREVNGVRFHSPKGFDPARLPFADLFRARSGSGK